MTASRPCPVLLVGYTLDIGGTERQFTEVACGLAHSQLYASALSRIGHWKRPQESGRTAKPSMHCLSQSVFGTTPLRRRLEIIRTTFRWLPIYALQRLTRRSQPSQGIHLIIAVADHFEPTFLRNRPGNYASQDEQRQRVADWCRRYPGVADDLRDSDGYPFRHTYFYPAEQHDKAVVEPLAEHCRAGWGEIEIHLHHGIPTPDTAENTRALLTRFRDALAQLGCLSRWDGQGPPRYAFVHGNWALANSAGGRYCGVDEEMEILSETGCYADFTLPSAQSPAQVTKINALYECVPPLRRRAPHRSGRDLRAGRPPAVFPLIIQGPLGLDFHRRSGLGQLVPGLEEGGLTGGRPASMRRLALWTRAGITVKGRPEWVFIKLHCHGMDSRDQGAVLGDPMREFLAALTSDARQYGYGIHFVTAREMVNIALAACDGRSGSPGDFRNYRLRLIASPRLA